MKTIKLNLMILLGILGMGITPAHGSQAEEPKMNGKLKVTTLSPEEIRYTGKPYNKELGAYVFNARNYSPEMSRWSTPDPSGFPDGFNNYLYVNNLSETAVDPNGKLIELFNRPVFGGLITQSVHSYIYFDVTSSAGVEGVGTISGVPQFQIPLLWGNLVSKPNNDLNKDQNNGQVLNYADYGYHCEYCLFLDLMGAASSYGNNLTYFAVPTGISGSSNYNSNGYISGILEALGITSVGYSYAAGWSSPIPLEYTPQYGSGSDCE